MHFFCLEEALMCWGKLFVSCMFLYSALKYVGLSLSFYMGIFPWLVMHSLLWEWLLSSCLSPRISLHHTVVGCSLVFFINYIVIDFMSFKILILTVNSFGFLCTWVYISTWLHVLINNFRSHCLNKCWQKVESSKILNSYKFHEKCLGKGKRSVIVPNWEKKAAMLSQKTHTEERCYEGLHQGKIFSTLLTSLDNRKPSHET